MALTLTVGRGKVQFVYADGNMTAAWDVAAEDGEEKLLKTMKQVIHFIEGEGSPTLPVREPGATLPPTPWVPPAPPALPDRLKADYELEALPPVPGNGWASLGDDNSLPEMP